MDVPWLPVKCSKRRIFGHADRNCTKKQMKDVKAWVPTSKKSFEVNKAAMTDVEVKETVKANNKGKGIIRKNL